MARNQPRRALPKGSKNQEHGSQKHNTTQQLLPDDAESDFSPSPAARKPLNQQDPLTAEQCGTKLSVDGKPLRRSPRFTTVNNSSVPPEPPTSDINKLIDPIEYWAREKHWPKSYSQTSKMAHLLARPTSVRARLLARPGSVQDTQATTPNTPPPIDPRPKEEKIPYKHQQYWSLLARKGSFNKDSVLGIVDESKQLIRDLLDLPQPVPKESLFDDDIFRDACHNLLSRNEARVARDVSRLIVPSAEAHALRSKNLSYLYEANDEIWSTSIPLIGPIPKPDYSVGFGFEAFTSDLHAKLSPFIGVAYDGDKSFFLGTASMYFPFLASELKCSATDLGVAERQNAHSMTLAVRGVAELFRWMKRESEVDRQILAFSIVHDHRSVCIYGHYPVMGKEDIQYWRHEILSADFTAQDGRQKWTAYRFTKNIYDIWVPAHLKRLSSVISQIPDDLDFAPRSRQNDPLQDQEGEGLSVDPTTKEGDEPEDIEQESDVSSLDQEAVEQEKKRKRRKN